jgi:hypothetical protein
LGGEGDFEKPCDMVSRKLLWPATKKNGNSTGNFIGDSKNVSQNEAHVKIGNRITTGF